MTVAHDDTTDRLPAIWPQDAALDAAIAAVGKNPTEVGRKNRVAVYYLLAEHVNKLELFHKTR